MDPETAKELSRQRNFEYARCISLLKEDSDIAGAEAIYDQGASNGLAAIVCYFNPNAEYKPNGRVKSAADLVKWLISAKESPVVNKKYVPIDMGKEKYAEIDFPLIAEAIRKGQSARHASLRRHTVSEAQIEALSSLSIHPALGGYSDYTIDRHWLKVEIRNRERLVAAQSYLQLLDADEVARRIEQAQYARSFSHDDDMAYVDLQDCPACGNTARIPESIDDFAMGTYTGTCFVCGYYLDADIAYWDGMSAWMEFRHSED